MPQACCDDIIVEDGRMGAAVRQHLAGFDEIFLRRFGGHAEADGRIDQMQVVDGLHAHHRQLVGDHLAVGIASGEHIAAGEAVRYTGTDMYSQAVE